MRKIALLGIAAGVVLGIGIFANIRLFGNNALAYQTSTEQKIKTIFWSVTNQEYGLKKIMNGMYAMKKDMKNDMQAMNDDLLQKKSFFEVEDEVTLSGNEPFEQSVLVQLVNCDPAIPLEKRAFHIETLGVSVSDPADFTSLFIGGKVAIDNDYILTLETDLGSRLFGGSIQDSPGVALAGPFAASDDVEFAYGANLDTPDQSGISFKAVAIGQMPQGCQVTVDADAPRTNAGGLSPPV